MHNFLKRNETERNKIYKIMKRYETKRYFSETKRNGTLKKIWDRETKRNETMYLWNETKRIKMITFLNPANYRRFCESRFFTKSIFSAIFDFFYQTQRLFVNASMTNKAHSSFLKSVENWPFGSKNKVFWVPFWTFWTNSQTVKMFCRSFSIIF
jgi:hypothetical protein